MNDATEVNFALDGQSISSAAQKLTELAAKMDYHAVASAPRTFQLVRRRRQKMRLRTEAMTLTFIEDRAGPRVRVIGDVDPILIEHLTGRPIGEPTAPPIAPVEAAADAPSNRSFSSPAEHYALPTPDARLVRPAAAGGGLISTVPGASNAVASVPDRPAANRIMNPAEVVAPVDVVNTVEAAVVLDDRTVKRDGLAAPTQPAVAVVRANGMVMALTAPVVVGRNPDPSVGPADSQPMPIADPSLSKSHCWLRMVPQGVVVHDLHSTNGTRIESAGQQHECVAGQETQPFSLPVVVWAGDVRLDLAAGSGGRP